jgi:phage baseplate assembly protein V
MSSDRINGLIRRCYRLLIDVTRPTTEVQIETLTDELHNDVEVFETYGWTMYPPDECPEGLVLQRNGESENGIVIAWRDPIFRPTFLLEGEVAFYSKWDQLIHFTQPGEVIIKDKAGTIVLLDAEGNVRITPAGGKTYINSDVVISGKLDVAQDTTLAAKLDVNGTSVKHAGVNIGKTHKHQDVSAGSDLSGVPV